MAAERMTSPSQRRSRTAFRLPLAGLLLIGFLSFSSPCPAKPADEKTESFPLQEKKQPDPLLQLIRSLTPEQKAKLIESIKTWQQLGPELKASLRARDKAIKKSLSDEVEAALEGTTFTKEQKELFEKRYKEERRKVDSALRAEFEARRKTTLEEIVKSLKVSVLRTDSN